MRDNPENGLPVISDSQVADDLCWLTEFLTRTGAAPEYHGGILGGPFGYGVEFENDTFMMHPYCWCERDDCPWCWGCDCPEDAWIYEVAGQRVDWQTFLDEYDRTGNSNRRSRKNEDLSCDYCRGTRVSAPNFLHKPSGTRVGWYKYIGRGMDVDVRGDWRTILAECVESTHVTPPAERTEDA